MTDNLDLSYMRMALGLAAKARGKTSPNPMVGAVLVKNNKVIGSGYHHFAGGPHAEVEAINSAGRQAVDSTLYVTLEPCNHYGKTPPCTEKIIASGIKKVFVAHQDPNPLVSGQGIQKLKENGIEVETGLFAEEAKELNEVFIKYITTKRPFVLLKGAISLDGRIAAKAGHSGWITGEQARLKVHELRNEYDAILVGIGTVLADDPELTSRLPNDSNRDPVRIILDAHCRIPLTAKVLNQESKAATIIAVSPKAPPENLKKVQELGAKIIVIPEEKGKLDLGVLLDELGKLQLTSLLVEGGANINGSFLSKNLIDKVCLFIAPKIIGANNSLSLIEGWGVERVEHSIRLNDLRIEKFGEDLGVWGYPEYGRGVV